MSLFGQPTSQPQFGAGGGLFQQNPQVQPQQQQQQSLFGGASQAPATGGGLFGGTTAGLQPQQMSQGIFAGTSQAATGGGLFGQQSRPMGAQTQGAFAQSPSFGGGGAAQPGATGSLFGGNPQQNTAQPFSQGLQGMGQQQQTQGAGLFGGSGQTGAFGAAQPQSSFGGFASLAQGSRSTFTAQQPGGTSAFGASTSAFGGGVSSGGTGSLFSVPPAQPNPIGTSQGAFGQPQSSFGGIPKSSFYNGATASQNVFGQPQPQPAGGGLFPQQPQQPPLQHQSSFGGGQQPGGSQQAIYRLPNEYNQLVSTVNVRFDPTIEKPDPKSKDQQPQPILQIHSMRGKFEFKHLSNEMLRLLDLQQQKGIQPTSYEWKAMQEFNQNQNAYPLLEQSKQRFAQNAGQAPGTGVFPGTSGTNIFGASQPAQSQFAIPQQTPGQTSTSIFGGGQPGAQQPGGFFSQSMGSSQSVFSATSAFGTQNPQGQPQSSLFQTIQTQNPQQPGGSLFAPATGQTQPQPTGAYGTTPNPAGGSLFPNPTQQPPTGQQSLFGAPKTGQPAQQTQLFSTFSTTGQTQQQQPGSSLFPSQPKQTGSLFGPQTTTQPSATPTGSFFTQPKPGTGQTSLFGPQTTTPGFPAQAPQGGSLFAPTTQPNPAPSATFTTPTGGFGPSSSLFGPQTTQNPSGPLFGPPTQQNGQNSLFGPTQPHQQQPQTQQQQTQAFNPMSVFQSSDPYGLQSGFMSQLPETADDIKQELQQIRKSAETAISIYDTGKASDLERSKEYTDYVRDQQVHYAQTSQPSQYMPLSLPIDQFTNDFEREEKIMRENQNSKYGYGSDIYNKEVSAQRKERESEILKKGIAIGYKDLWRNPSVEQANLYSSQRMNNAEMKLLTPKSETNSDDVPDLSKRILRGISENWKKTASNESSSQISQSQAFIVRPGKIADCINLKILLKYEDFDVQELEVKIHKSRDIQDIHDRTSSWMCQKFNFQPQEGQSFKLFYKNRALSKNSSIKDAGLDDESTIYIQIDDDSMLQVDDKKSPKQEQNQLKDASPRADKQIQQQVAEEAADGAPKPPKEGYMVNPSMLELENMTNDQLKLVMDFKVWNEYGSVEFLGGTDVSGVDLKDVITIDASCVEVYDDQRHIKPKIGDKLNKPALITRKNIKPDANKRQTSAQLEQKLKKILAADPEGAQHISYDPLKCTWQFKVFHFTKWGEILGDDSDEEEVQDQLPRDTEESKIDKFKEITKKAEEQFIPTFESQKIAAQQDQEMIISQVAQAAPSISASVRYNNGKRQLLDRDFDRDSAIIEVDMSESSRQKVQQQQNRDDMRLYSHEYAGKTKTMEVQEKIRERENLFKQASPLTCQKPSNKETMDYLNKLGIRSGFAKTSLRSGIPRPCFSPNGQIAFVSGDKIRVVSTLPIKSPESQNLCSTVLEHTSVEKKNVQELGSQLETLLSDHQGTQNAQRSLFNDNFFHKLISKQLPGMNFCRKDMQTPALVQITDFLVDLAKQMAQMSSEKAKHEFIVVCMLNALFGNPNLHLVQFHPNYSGPRTINRDLTVFKNFDSSEGENSLNVLKKRRNAVCEVLRFHCQQVHRALNQSSGNKSDTEIYARALHMLKNGDLRGAMRYLSSSGKNRLAMIVAKGANAQLRRELFQSMGKIKEFAMILDHISPDQAVGGYSWDQELLRSLLFSNHPNRSLLDFIRHLDESKRNTETKSILWTLLRIYARCRDSVDSVKKFDIELTPECSQRDYSLRWLLQLVLRESITRGTLSQKIQTVGIYGQQPFLDDAYFTQTCSQFIRQLQVQGDWRSALLVCGYIPAKHANIRNRISYEVLSQHAGRFLTPSESSSRDMDSHYVTSQLNLPVDWIKVTRALCLQNLNLYELALQEWLNSDNLRQAHEIFHGKILPLYMHRSANVSLLKALHLGDKLTHAERSQLIKEQRICHREAKVDQLVEEFYRAQTRIPSWDTQTGNFRKFTQHLLELSEKGFSTGDACRSFIGMVRAIQTYSRDEVNDPIDNFISQEIATIGNFLQMKEDEANIREGRERHPGVRQLAEGNFFKFQSDQAIVAQNRPRITREAEQLVLSQLLNRVCAQ